MKTLDTMTKDEKSLLLFFETQAVDYGGKINDTRHMNKEDFEIAEQWNREGFIKFGRIRFHSIVKDSYSTRWCELSDEAWILAHAERKARYKRIISQNLINKTQGGKLICQN